MRCILCLVILFFVMLSCTLPSYASGLLIDEEVVLTEKNPAAYRAWAKKGSAFKSAYPWSSVWKDNCKRLNIPCTDKAWRNVAVGTIFLLPLPSPLPMVSSDGAGTVVVAPLQQKLNRQERFSLFLIWMAHNAQQR